MELIVFDLDGTLLNRESAISEYTSETLKLLSSREIAYTVATGRTLHGARAILQGHRFDLPQAYKNGVMIWHPQQRRFSSSTRVAYGCRLRTRSGPRYRRPRRHARAR
jgi:HAD superfamily hydrolase (TIGR01484 family)